MLDTLERDFDVAVLAADLESLFGERMSRAQAVRDHHGKDESAHPASAPDIVVFARSTEEVAAAVKACARHKAPVIAYGVGTSLEGQIQAYSGGVCIDLSGMDQILEVRAEDMDVTVQAGVRRRQLDSHLRDTGLFFPVDPGADASLGGMAATGASGTTTLRYGAMRENTLAATVVSADGSIIKIGTRARKSSAGYDLMHLMIGSEGTLGIITELTLRLYGRPEAIAAGVCTFPDIAIMVDTVTLAIQSEIPLGRMEMMDEIAVFAVNAHAGLENEVKPTLFLEFQGTEASVADDIARFEEIAIEQGGTGFVAVTSLEARNKLWRARHAAFDAGRAFNPGKLGLITDVCVPVSRLAECIALTRQDFDDTGLLVAFVGHVGDGNFHTTIWVEPDDAAAIKTAHGIMDRMSQRAIDMGGTCTGEHGIGVGKLAYLEAEHATAMPWMRAIKAALDPDNILNPGKVLR